jgi:hypothetical protein
MSETFYRVHWDDAPEFSEEHAWSALWGSEFSADGTQTRCHSCDDGMDWDRNAPCSTCDGTGWEDCLRGYSCCTSAEQLVAYFAEHGAPDDDDTVVIFEGRCSGTGFDGETLAIPEGAVQTMTWSEFAATAAAQ